MSEIKSEIKDVKKSCACSLKNCTPNLTKDRTFCKIVEIATPIIIGSCVISIGIIWFVTKLWQDVKGSGYQ